MKKQIIYLSAVALLATAAIFTGCGGKDDITKPVVGLDSASTITIALHGTYTEPGAHATDEQDGALTPVISGTVNKDAAGTYTITYTATDAAGNVGTATRTVIVMHTAATTAGSFATTDVSGTSTTNYIELITAATGSTVRLNTTRFANYDNTVVYFELSGETGSTVTVPSQTVTNSGNPAATRVFSGTGTVSADGKTVIINYTETTNNTTATGTGTYVK